MLSFRSAEVHAPMKMNFIAHCFHDFTEFPDETRRDSVADPCYCNEQKQVVGNVGAVRTQVRKPPPIPYIVPSIGHVPFCGDV